MAAAAAVAVTPSCASASVRSKRARVQAADAPAGDPAVQDDPNRTEEYTEAERARRRVRPLDCAWMRSTLRTDMALTAVLKRRWAGVRPGEEGAYLHLLPLIGSTGHCPRNHREVRLDAGLVVALTLAHPQVAPPTALFVCAREPGDVLVHERVAAHLIDVGWYTESDARLERATVESVARGERTPLYFVSRANRRRHYYDIDTTAPSAGDLTAAAAAATAPPLESTSADTSRDGSWEEPAVADSAATSDAVWTPESAPDHLVARDGCDDGAFRTLLDDSWLSRML